MHNNSTFGDKQLIKLQESPEMIPEGETYTTKQLSQLMYNSYTALCRFC